MSVISTELQEKLHTSSRELASSLRLYLLLNDLNKLSKFSVMMTMTSSGWSMWVWLGGMLHHRFMIIESIIIAMVIFVMEGGISKILLIREIVTFIIRRRKRDWWLQWKPHPLTKTTYTYKAKLFHSSAHERTSSASYLMLLMFHDAAL